MQHIYLLDNTQTRGTDIDSVLITGAGFLAKGLTKELLYRGVRRVCIYSRNEYSQYLFAQSVDNDRLRMFLGDVRDKERLEIAMRGIDTVIHTAALKRVEVGRYNPTEMLETNVTGSSNVIKTCAAAGVRRAILISSDKAVEPLNCYGVSKAAAEHLWIGANDMSLGPEYVAVRYGNVAGSTGSLIPIWRAAKGEVEVRHPDATRFWMSLDDAVQCVMREMDSQPGSIDMPTMPAYRLADMAEAMGVRYRVTKLQPGEKMHESIMPGVTSEHARRMSVTELREALERV